MWKLNIASKLAGGPSIPGIPGKPKTEYHKFARYGGLASGGLLVILGVITLILGSYFVGPICILLGILALVLEIPISFACLREPVNFFNDFRWKAIFFVV